MVGISNCCPKYTGNFASLTMAYIIEMHYIFTQMLIFHHFQLLDAFYSILNHISLSINEIDLTISGQNLKIRDILYRHAFSKQQKGKHCTMG